MKSLAMFYSAFSEDYSKKNKSFLSNRKIHVLCEKDFVNLGGSSSKASFFHEASITLQMLNYFWY